MSTLITSSPKTNTRKTGRSYDLPSSSSFPPNSHTIVLLSLSHELAFELSDVINQVESSVDALSTQTDLKAIILDADFARRGYSSMKYILTVL
jgi:hypothetical protein